MGGRPRSVPSPAPSHQHPAASPSLPLQRYREERYVSKCSNTLECGVSRPICEATDQLSYLPRPLPPFPPLSSPPLPPLQRYCEERYVPKYIATIGVDYGVKPTKFGATDARLNLWDLAGGEDYLEARGRGRGGARRGFQVQVRRHRRSAEPVGPSRWGGLFGGAREGTGRGGEGISGPSSAPPTLG